MSHLNSSTPFAASLGRLPITMLRMVVVLALALFVQGAMAQATTTPRTRPLAAKVDPTGTAPAATPPAAAPERAAVPKTVAPAPAPTPQAAHPGTAAPQLTEPRVPLPSELHGTRAKRTEGSRTPEPATGAAPASAPVAPAHEVKQP